jgi:transposase
MIGYFWLNNLSYKSIATIIGVDKGTVTKFTQIFRETVDDLQETSDMMRHMSANGKKKE